MAAHKTILVTGANGQLGQEFRAIALLYPQYNFLFTGKDDLAIENFETVHNFFSTKNISFCINCAAYTAVDKAETEIDKAFLINATAVENLASVCKQYQAQLIHISTDYVFNGNSQQAYKETDNTNPASVYGQSKLKGEQLALIKNPSTIIIRTSWVYSSFQNNFVKTMLRLMKEKESINVVNDQTGCPTYANDLAKCIMSIVAQNETLPNKHAIYNYCNQGAISWYQFATTIKELTNSSCIITPIPTSQYPTPAKRPLYSVLNTSLIQSTFAIEIPQWKHSLQKCLQLLSKA
jgi:dTDP-4-dehydrorhamnose reductase